MKSWLKGGTVGVLIGLALGTFNVLLLNKIGVYTGIPYLFEKLNLIGENGILYSCTENLCINSLSLVGSISLILYSFIIGAVIALLLGRIISEKKNSEKKSAEKRNDSDSKKKKIISKAESSGFEDKTEDKPTLYKPLFESSLR